MYIPKGVREASNILSISDKFLIYYDPDVDGVCAGEIVRRVLFAFNRSFTTHINENRQHGLKLTREQLELFKGYTIILVDAGMTKEEVELLVSMGINIINIDHHSLKYNELVYIENTETGCKGVMINNQYPFEPEEYRFLSGAGMVYYVFKAMFPQLIGLDEKALVGLSLLSDIRPLDSDKAKEFLHTTYNHRSDYMEYLVRVVQPEYDFGFGVPTLDRNFIDYTFSPKINALFRLNKGDIAIKIFAGVHSPQGELEVYRRIQNAIRDTILENSQGEELSNLSYRYVDYDMKLPYEYEITNFVGLACSDLKNKGKTSIMFVRQGNDIKRGSVRGLCDDVNYLEIFRRFGFVAEGHHNAFGIISVDLENVDLNGLNEAITEAEQGYEERQYKGRILEVSNLSFFLKSKNIVLSEYNNYVKDSQRVYLKYTGKNIERYQKGKAIEWVLDGVKVMAFKEEVTPENGLLLPIKERGYNQFFLKEY